MCFEQKFVRIEQNPFYLNLISINSCYNEETAKQQLNMKQCTSSALKRVENKLIDIIQRRPQETQLNQMFYSFSLHPAHPELIYQNTDLLGGLKDIFQKQYPAESTIFGPIYQHEMLIFVSRWSFGNVYVGQRLQIKTKQQFQIFQTYLQRKYLIPKIQHLLIPETFTEYMSILSNFRNEQLKKDPIFLGFVGVIGQIATFGLDTIPNKGLTHQIYQNQYVYYERQVIHHNQNHCFNIIKRCLGLREQGQTFHLKLNSQSLVLCSKSPDGQLQIVEMLVLTSQIQVRIRIQSVTEYFNIKITNGINFIFIAFETFYDILHFVTTLNLCLEDSGYLQKNNYLSFSIQRQNCLSHYYIDGQKYFFDLCETLKRATREVCITDWMLTPYLLLKRPDDLQNGKSRLDKILFQLADEKKVEIFILIYGQPQLMFQDSVHVEQYFEKNRRIHVIRHPDVFIPIMWSHHQKMVIIDQKIAFMGGFDITYGRWDTSEHSIIDTAEYWPGRDYRNDRIKEVSSPRKFQIPDLDRQNDPRMPWHDIGIRVEGRSVIDLKRHFTQYWYFAIKDLTRPNRFLNDQLQFKVSDVLAEIQQNQPGETEYFTRQQQIRYYQKRLKKSQSQLKNLEKKQRTNKFRITIGVNLQTYYTLTLKGWYDYSYIQKMQGLKVKHHLVRSSSNWSMGMLEHVQQSIHFAYIELIRNAKQFIYIENQFFMGLEHKVIETIIQRIERAYKNKQNFKVLVMLPLLPGFPGEVYSSQAAVMKIQLHWQYHAINRGKKSIFKKLAYIPDLWNYISFFGLRNYGQTIKDKKPITEIIYIHSKLMIIDDKYTLIGSANINDRSMLGWRDSQIAVITEDMNLKSIPYFRAKLFQQHFDLTHHEATNFIDSKKRHKIWNKMIEIAKRNTEIYRQIFACYPDDNYSTLSDIEKNIKKQVQQAVYEILKEEIRGHVVLNPLQFLEKQVLTFKGFELESFAPPKTFT